MNLLGCCLLDLDWDMVLILILVRCLEIKNNIMAKVKNKDSIVISRKAFIPIVFLVLLVGIILSKRDFGALVVLILGVGVGVFIGHVWHDSGESEGGRKR